MQASIPRIDGGDYCVTWIRWPTHKSKFQWKITIKEDFSLKTSANESQSHQLWCALITTTVLQTKLAFARLANRSTIRQPQIIKVKSSNPKTIRITRLTNITSTWIKLQIILQVNYHDKVLKGRSKAPKVVQREGITPPQSLSMKLSLTTLLRRQGNSSRLWQQASLSSLGCY